MAGMNIFESNAFGTVDLSGTVEKIDYAPSMLGSMNLFEKMPVRDKRLFVERRDGKLALIGTSPTGAPPEELLRDQRDAVPLTATRLAKGFTLYATEVQGIRGFGSESDAMAVRSEYLRRMARVRQDMELTHENHRLGALQGKLLDADGTTVIYDYFDEFDEAKPAAIPFALGTDTTDVRAKCMAVTRAMAVAARGSFTPSTTVHALAGDVFFDKLIGHKDVKATYLNHQAAADLRANVAYGSFVYGGITFHNYRGTEDTNLVSISDNEAQFFPVGARDVFKHAMAPHESIEYANTPGRDTYAVNVIDRDRNFWTRGELYSYPLYFCQQPRVLQRGTTN